VRLVTTLQKTEKFPSTYNPMLTEKKFRIDKIMCGERLSRKVLLSAWPTMENFASAEEAEAEHSASASMDRSAYDN
jgi:hypothetical protein